MHPKNKTFQVCLLLIAALAFGGGGSGTGLANLCVQLAALTLAALNLDAFIDFFRTAPRLLTSLVGISLLLPLLQSLPLPPFVWQSLPGRELAVQSLKLVDASEDWRPLSLEVHRTLIAFLSLIPAATALVLSWSMTSREKQMVMAGLALSGGALVLAGIPQLASGNHRFVFYAEALGSDDLHGFFANRNTAGLFLDMALCALIGSIPSQRPAPKWIAASASLALLLILGLVLTRSRSSMALAVIPFVFASYRILRARKGAGISASRKQRFAILGACVLLAGTATAAGLMNDRLQASFTRFENLDDRRPEIWKDSLGAIQRFWPVGSGIGTFDEVFQLDESLEFLGPGRAARAHNDYLEVALESGAIGIALLSAWVVYLALLAIRALQRGPATQAALAILILITFQSISDYPMRNQTILCIAGFILAALAQTPRLRSRNSPTQETAD